MRFRRESVAKKAGFGEAPVVALLLATLAVAPIVRAAFPGVNGHIAFNSNRDGNYNIYAMNPDGSTQTRLTNNPADDEHPSWSTTGGKIAFDSNRDGNQEIYIMEADGSSQTRLTNNPAADSEPAWSPDGRKIVFESDRDGNIEIYVMNADGSAQTNLTNNPAQEENPNWSPDGTKIAFDSTRDGNREIYVMNADGSNQTRLTNNPALDSDPNWSPDGMKLVFVSARTGSPEIFTMNADGSGQTRLTSSGSFDADPSWSPDGQKIAFSSTRAGSPQIFIMNADGSAQTRLTNNSASEGFPDWGSNIEPLPTPSPTPTPTPTPMMDRLPVNCFAAGTVNISGSPGSLNSPRLVTWNVRGSGACVGGGSGTSTVSFVGSGTSQNLGLCGGVVVQNLNLTVTEVLTRTTTGAQRVIVMNWFAPLTTYPVATPFLIRIGGALRGAGELTNSVLLKCPPLASTGAQFLWSHLTS